MGAVNEERVLRLHGVECPHAFVRAKLALEELPPGAVLKVIVDNAISSVDLPRSARQHGYEVLSVEEVRPGTWEITLRTCSDKDPAW